MKNILLLLCLALFSNTFSQSSYNANTKIGKKETVGNWFITETGADAFIVAPVEKNVAVIVDELTRVLTYYKAPSNKYNIIAYDMPKTVVSLGDSKGIIRAFGEVNNNYTIYFLWPTAREENVILILTKDIFILAIFKK